MKLLIIFKSMDINKISKHAVKYYNAEDGEVEEFMTQFLEVIDNPKFISEVLIDFISNSLNDQDEANKFFGYQRWGYINFHYEFYNFFCEYPTSDNVAINNILALYKPILEEQKKYWGHMYCVLPESNKTNKQFDCIFKLELIENYFSSLIDKINKTESTKIRLSEETKNIIKDLFIMLGNINDFSDNAQIDKINLITYESLIKIKKHLVKETDIQYISNFISLFEDDSELDEKETLSTLICHSESQKIVNNIRIQYKNIGGKRLKILLICLQELDLLPKENIASKFHKLCKNEFSWNIKSYSAMNDYKYNENIDKDEKQFMLAFLKKIINNT